MKNPKPTTDNQNAVTNAAMWRELLKTPFCLLWYMHKTQRRVFVDKEGFMFLECPSLECHAVCDECKYPAMEEYERENRRLVIQPSEDDEADNMRIDLTARIVTERGTGITRIDCNRCGASWDVFGLYQIENHCTREKAILDIAQSFMNATATITVNAATVTDK